MKAPLVQNVSVWPLSWKSRKSGKVRENEERVEVVGESLGI